jgi:glyoxylase-like metal-dependent hydrolase (beta-lactamase superfamily II)
MKRSITGRSKKTAGLAILCAVLSIALVMGITACASKPLAAVGDIIKFGGIDWRVLEVKNGNALVLSDKILLKMKYDEAPYQAAGYYANITWEKCDVREYLNGEFYDSTFSAGEKKQIISTGLKHNDNPWWPKTGEGGNDTTDKVFLLSLDEVLQYFGDSGEVERHDSNQKSLGLISDQFNKGRIAETQEGEAAWWWLRTSGGNVVGAGACFLEVLAVSVQTNGGLSIKGDHVTNVNGGVRPALWLKNGDLEISGNNEIKNNAAQTEELKQALPDTEEFTYAMPEIKSDYMEITTHTVGSYEANCYFVTNKQSQETVIIDPGDEEDLLRRMMEENELKPVAILLTHAHFDHIGAAESLKRTYEIPIYAWIDERDNFSGSALAANNITWLDNGNTPLEIAGFFVRVIYTPGHTVGSVCYYVESENVLFSGDTMFWGTYGRTDLDTGDLDAIINSFENKLYILPNNTIVYPGHGITTTISDEKEHNSINGLMQ